MAEAKTAHSKAESEWQRALELERRLKATYRKRSFYDQEARTLRGQLRAAYESLLFLDAAFAAANDVELLLWKSVFYRPIEEFRARLKQADKAGDAGAAAGPKVAAAFVRFLEDASLFYRRLVMQLQAAYGDVGVKLAVEAQAGAAAAAAANGAAAKLSSSGSSAPRDVRPSIHRCLIYLGDLARYTAQAAPKATPAAAGAAGCGQHPAARQEWQRAAHCYRLAARVLPRSGNPHNQLAVMAVMTGDELRAVYHYARSLCVGIPFLTARENLTLLFEQNRVRYREYVAQRRQRQPQQRQQQHSLGQLLSEVSICHVRLSGLLFDKINEHEFHSVAASAAAALGAFLGHPAALDGLQRQVKADSMPMHLVVLSIFAVHNACSSGAERKASGSEAAPGAGSGGLAAAAGQQGLAGAAGSYGDAAQRSMQRSRALTTAFGTGQLLLQAAAAATAAQGAAAGNGSSAGGGPAAGGVAQQRGVSRLLAAANVLLQWLAAHPSFAVLHPTHASDEEGRARAAFWAAAAQLLAALTAAFPAEAALGASGKATRGVAAAAAAQAGAGAAAAAGAGGGSGSAGGGASCDGGALPEELELLGFEPLRSKHHWHVTDVGKAAVDEPATRACRMLAAARITSASLSAEQQLARHGAAAAAGGGGGVQPQTLKQLAAAVRQFVEAVAAAAAPGGAAGPSARLLAQASAGGGRLALQLLLHLPQAAVRQQQQQQHEDEEEDAEEVIVFKPRTAWPSAASSDDGRAAAPAPAGARPPAAQQPSRLPPPAAAAAAAAGAAEPPPLPQQLLASRQQGRLSASSSQSPNGVSSPAAGASSPVRQQQRQQQHQPEPMIVSPAGSVKHGEAAAAAAEPAKVGDAVGSRSSVPRSGSGTPAAAAAAGGGGSGGAAGVLLQGHAATALDLQQAQAASDMLLARLNARAPALPPLGGSGGGLPPAPGFGSFGGGFPQGPAPGFTKPSSGLGGSSMRSQPPPPAMYVSAAAAGVPLDVGAIAGGMQLPAGVQQQQQQQLVLGFGGNFEGFDPLGFGLSSALSPGGTGAGFDDPISSSSSRRPKLPLRPVDIAQQQALQQQQQLGSSATAVYELEQTARAAADKILSPEHDTTGLRLLQQQRTQQQQQQQHSGVGALVPGFGSTLAPATGLAGSSDLAAAAAAAAGGLAPALQPQQHVLHRELSGGNRPLTSPSALTASFGRDAFDAQQQLLQQQQQPQLGRISAPSMRGRPSDDGLLYSPAAAAAAAAVADNSGLQDSGYGYAMFSGPSMFGGRGQGSGSGLGLGEGLGPDSPTSPEGDGLTLLEYLAKQQQQQQQQPLIGSLAGVTPDAAFGNTAGGVGGFSAPPGFSGLGPGASSFGPSAQQDLGSGLGNGAYGGVGVGGGGGAAPAVGLFQGGRPAVLLPPLDVVQSQNPFAPDSGGLQSVR
ncbi:hypothetical protein COO60DRAFT_1643170 [Scenedesmus sp. NREL 46B-D3]|nr:hypothetical protein COO60DRAFT_1643170 [Scenedesmus sp. NREL 46B-D3]